MSTSDSHDQHTDQRDTQDSGRPSHEDVADAAQLSEEGRKEIRRMAEAYKDKPTVKLPGTHGTISGTSINEWLDDEGNPKFGDPDEHPFAEGESPGENAH